MIYTKNKLVAIIKKQTRRVSSFVGGLTLWLGNFYLVYFLCKTYSYEKRCLKWKSEKLLYSVQFTMQR